MAKSDAQIAWTDYRKAADRLEAAEAAHSASASELTDATAALEVARDALYEAAPDLAAGRARKGREQ